MRLTQPAKAQFSPEQREYYELAAAHSGAATGPDGQLLGPAAVGVHNPGLGLSSLRATKQMEANRILSKRVVEIVVLTVAVALKDEFIWYAHTTHYKQVAGTTDDVIESIRQGLPLKADDPIEVAAYKVTRAAIERGDLTDEEFAEATTVLTVPQLIEITLLIGRYWTHSLQMRVFQVGPPAGVPLEFVN